MRVSVVQMNPGANKDENIAQARSLLDQAISADHPDIVSLPEVWDSLGGDRSVRNANAEILPAKGSNEPGGPAYEFLRDVARGAKVHVHGGSIIEQGVGDQGPEKLFNTTVVFDPDGQEIARYRKMHLFDIVAPDGTGYRESATYGAGDEVVTYDADGVKVGCAICYDLRFPDLFWSLRAQGAELIFLPSAFTLATGKDHWEVLIRGRADRDAVLVRRPRHHGSTWRARARRASPTATPWSATPGARWSPRSPTASAGRPRASIPRSPPRYGATCRCWNTGSACEPDHPADEPDAGVATADGASADRTGGATPDDHTWPGRVLGVVGNAGAGKLCPPRRPLWRLRGGAGRGGGNPWR